MTRHAYTVALLCVGAAGLGLPAVGAGASGARHASRGDRGPNGVDDSSGGTSGAGALGSGASGGGGLSPGAGGPYAEPQAQPGDVTVSASANGITLVTKASAFVRHALWFTGGVPRSDAGDLIEIQRSKHGSTLAWSTAASSTVQPDGSYAVVWRVDHTGRFAVRAVLVQGDGASASEPSASGGATDVSPGGTGASPNGASTSSGWPAVTVTVYRRSVATLFGPGFYGDRTACGEVLHRDTVGVANRTLPCGTMVAVYYRGWTLVIPVIDRGPYANGADWDLTMATGRALGILTTVTLGAVSLPRADG